MKDDALQEVRHIRHQISEECGHDVHQVAAYYRKIEQELRESGQFRFQEDNSSQAVTSPPQSKRF